MLMDNEITLGTLFNHNFRIERILVSENCLVPILLMFTMITQSEVYDKTLCGLCQYKMKDCLFVLGQSKMQQVVSALYF